MPHKLRWYLLSAAAGLAIAALALALAVALAPPPDAERQPLSPQRTARAFQLQGMRPDLAPDATTALLDQSDAVVSELRAQGVVDVGSEISDRLAGIQLTEADRRAFFSANRHLFGQRDYQQSRWAVAQLLRIQRARTELGITRVSAARSTSSD